MELTPGYKQTEVGVIPEDWEVKRIADLGDVVRGGSPRPAGDKRYFNGDFIPWLTVAALTNVPEYQLEITETASCLTEEGSRHSRTLPAGTLIIANSGATLGVAKLLTLACCANDGIAAIINQRLGEKRFVCFYFNTQTKRFREVVATGNGQPNLNTGLICSIPIPFPSLTEQRAIAAALSDVDALLSALDRLIAKKRDLKQAAMQQLLTGQTRLPGFSGEWEEASLDMLTSRATGVWGQTEPDERHSRRAEIIRAGDISQDGRLTATATRFVAPEEFEKAECALDDLVITTSGNGLGKLWWCDGRKNIAASNFVRVLRPIPARSSGRFLYYALRTGDGLRQLQEHTATSAYPNLRPSYFSTNWIPLPPSSEQTAIAAVLSDVDAEIEALEARRAKTRDLKQAMMQELLTGRMRLV